MNLDTGIIQGVDDIELPCDLEDETVEKLNEQKSMSQAEVIEVFHGLIKTILWNARDYRYRVGDGLTETFIFDSIGFIWDVRINYLGFDSDRLAHDPRTKEFYSAFVDTQMFSQYIATVV